MSRKPRNRRPQAVRQESSVNQSPPVQYVQDAFLNPLAKLGESNPMQRASQYQRGGISGDMELLTTLYRENWIAKKIIDLPAEDMTRAWYTLKTQTDAGKLDELMRMESRHHIKQELTDAIRWARLYGGALAVMVIKGQEHMLSEPLDLDLVMPDSFCGLIVLDRWCGVSPSLELVSDMDDPDFGLPESYDITATSMGNQFVRVHHSRVLRFVGRTLPVVEEESENYWGASELEHIYEEMLKRDMTSANISQLLFQANVRTLKMAGYGQYMSLGTRQSQQRVMTMVQRQNALLSNYGTQVMDAGDSLETHQYTFSGIAEVYETFMLDMAGAAEIPATKLFGRAPQGMNATGESDLAIYHESIRQKQEALLRPPLEKLLPILCLSVWGMVPDDLEIAFAPLSETKVEQKAAIIAQYAAAVGGLITSGVISQRTALLELREMGAPFGFGTKITDEDVDEAGDMLNTGEQEIDIGHLYP